jgi:hypothetical protein
MPVPGADNNISSASPRKTGDITRSLKKINNFDPNQFVFNAAQKAANFELTTSFINKNIEFFKSSLKGISIQAGCDERNASQALMNLDKALVDNNEEAVTKGLAALGVTSEDDVKKFMELAKKNNPGEKLTGNYSLHILRSMTMLKETISAINASNLTKDQKELMIRNINVDICCGGITTKRGNVNNPEEYAADRYFALEAKPTDTWSLGKDEKVAFLVDNSPSAAVNENLNASTTLLSSFSATFLNGYLNMNKDAIKGGAEIIVTRYSGSGQGLNVDNNYKTFLTINEKNIQQLDITKALKSNINGLGSSRERMLDNTITMLAEIKNGTREKVDKIYVESDEGFQKDFSLKNLQLIQSLKQSTGVKEVCFVVFDKQGVPNTLEAGDILTDFAKLNGGNEDHAKEMLFNICAHVNKDGQIIRYDRLKGDELFQKNL